MFFYIWIGGIVLAALIFCVAITLHYDCDNLSDAFLKYEVDLRKLDVEGATVAWAVILLFIWPISLSLFGAFIALFLFPYKLIVFSVRSLRSKK